MTTIVKASFTGVVGPSGVKLSRVPAIEVTVPAAVPSV